MARRRKKVKTEEINIESSDKNEVLTTTPIIETPIVEETNMESNFISEPINQVSNTVFDGSALYKDIKIVKSKKVGISFGPKFSIKLSFNKGKNLVKFFIKVVIGIAFKDIMKEANKFYFANKNKVNADSCLIEIFDENRKLVLSKIK